MREFEKRDRFLSPPATDNNSPGHPNGIGCLQRRESQSIGDDVVPMKKCRYARS